MPITQLTPMSHIVAALKTKTETAERLAIRALARTGEECVNRARESNTYTDQTGNLRSSIGYVIVKDGHIIKLGDFNTVKGGDEGKMSGVDFAKQLVSNFPRGLALVVVAGMQYAGYVEAMGLDVISGQELYAERRVKELLSKLI